MSIFLLFIAVILLFLGHVMKVLRWRQFIEIYEKAGGKLLLRSLAYGQLFNYIFPFRLGDFIRVFWAGKKMENGIAFSLATVVLDRCLDVWVVGLLFGISICAGGMTPMIQSAIRLYVFLAISLLLFLIVAFRFSKVVKKAAKRVCSVFNEQIELTLLVFLWSGITAVKDMLKRISKTRLLANTVCMWFFYLLSYYTISASFAKAGFNISFFDVFTLLFDGKQLNMSTFLLTKAMGVQIAAGMSIYILLPLLFLLIMSAVPSSLAQRIDKIPGVRSNKLSMLHLLPQVKPEDRLDFLEKYFEAEDREYLQAYIDLNRDVLILEDLSAGSNATTMLCMNESNTFYRKYAFGKDADKLVEQIQWLEDHKKDIPLPEVQRKQIAQGFCCYDMPYYSTAIGMFQYLHSAELSDSWGLLEAALQELHRGIHQKNIRMADPKIIEQYIEQKVLQNLAKMERAHELEPLLHYDTLVINGKVYRGYSALKRQLRKEKLLEIFSQDHYSDIHGDLTIENIVCWKKKEKTDHYFIDPNTGNLHESPSLDYSKLLQSLHGGYEFLVRTNIVDVDKNQIHYLSTISQRYKELFQEYRKFLDANFTSAQVRSIYFHEIVHWIRLMPYKIEKSGKRAVLFFSGLIIVFNDIVDWYGEF